MKKLLRILSFGLLYKPDNSPFGPLQRKWLKSLETHPERQMRGRLGLRVQDGLYKACCLGEAGLISGGCKWNGDILSTVNGQSSTILTDVYSMIGLRSSSGEPYLFTNEKLPYLTTLNDGGMTWPEIAAHLRTHPNEYFEKFV